MLRHHISSVSGEYIKSQKLANKVGFTTSQPLPEVELAENEYFAMLDAAGNVQYWPDDTGCTWQVKTRFEKVTAYHKQTQQSKQFDDKSLVDDEYTLNKPLPHSTWQDSDWVQQIALLQEAKKGEANQWRYQQEADASTIVEANGHSWDAGPEARARIDSALLTQQMPPYWTDADNNDHVGMTLVELRAVKVAIGELGFQIHHRQRTMKKEIEAITDFAKLEAYQVGWPAS
ncbi:DUF4376 domain-containing protein [Vibrio coralliilyticus]|uniref:DUF4376 domain-containing protein n=1 Tax=Vibrio coralliilyticus TaxID=190893 RepID=UPI001561015D|nr:DUF4376 domain-containing protein [Vibrio coralliilyticus]NRF60912.1 DUF4376 domain-containing protein [Vibrio coralliilyticus]